MISKYLILIDEQSQSAVLQNIKATLRNDGVELVYKEFNPINYQRRENGEILFDIESFKDDLLALPYFNQLDSIVCDYNLIAGIIDGFQIVKIIKSINPNYKKQVILYSAQIENVIEDIINTGDFEKQKENLKSLINCNIDFRKRDNDYEQELIKHIKKEKEFNFEDELVKWFFLRKEDTFNYLFPKYRGKKFEEIALCLQSNTLDSIEFKKDLIEQIISYLSSINDLN
ncbi:hypothetical protein [uncultured Bacteroides sp.]|uniref:hypothetical protein n=1 Tax=uncultured Bacteroides sp. TaxID=162156 RepID=UPI0026082E66|nr:hypothetical protein [uncultured Bacteroides sp.]